MKIEPVIDHIKDSILKFVPARYIYLFGSHAYGNPTEKSDIDIFIVTPDNIDNFTELYSKIIVDLSYKKIFFIDLLLSTESVFNTRKNNNIFEQTIHQKGKIIYECGLLNRFANDIRYPHHYETNETDTNLSISAAEKIRNFKPILDLRNNIKFWIASQIPQG